MRENNKEMAIVRIGNDIGLTWSFFQTQPGVSWKVPFDLTNLDLSLTLFSPLTGDVAIHDFSVTDNSLHWVFKGKDQSKLGKYTLTLTVNKGQDNQHVVDRIEFLELVSRSNSGVIRHGCAHGDRSVLDTECIALGTVVDYGYETVAHAMMTYARKEDMEAMMRNAYLAISRKAEGLFKVDYDALDEDYARDYFEHRAPALNAGGCSVVAHGGLVGRNMDWLKRHPDGSVDAVFEVHTSAAQGRYASFGFAGSLAELSVEKVESREYSDAYKLLPYYMQDGQNEKGLMAAILVVPATSSRVAVPEVEKRDRVCSLALVRYILDHYQSVDEAVNSLRDYVEIFHPASLTAMGYEPHFFLKDSIKSVVLEFSGTGIVTIEINVCTNFHLHGVTLNPDGTVWTNADVLDGHLPSSQGIENYGSGLERFNTMVTAAPESKEDMRELLDSILFSKAYTLTEGVWNSEFVGGNITVDTPADDQALLARLEEYRQKYADDADDVWITKQSVIYDLANFSASLTVFEGSEEYEAALDQNENVATKEFVEERVANFITRSVNDLVNYYLKSETYTKTEVQALISAVQQFAYEVVAELPAASASTMHKIYLVPSSSPKAQNVKDEFITIDNGTSAETRYTWEWIGSTTIDLSNYPTFAQMTSAINAALAGYVTTSALTLLLAGKQDALNATQLAAVNSGITSEKVAEIDGKYVKPNTGIPSTDMTTEVQTTLGKVTELEQEVSDLQDLWEKGEGDGSVQKKGAIALGDGSVAEGHSILNNSGYISDITKLSDDLYEITFTQIGYARGYFYSIQTFGYILYKQGDEFIQIPLSEAELDEEGKKITVTSENDLTTLLRNQIYHCVASNGGFSHTESGSHAIGDSSHAEAFGISVGNESHAEGAFSVASGWGSHSEGHGTLASGNYSHSEGQYTKATGSRSHTEGNKSIASGQVSHAEGQESQALGNCSHTEGNGTIARGRVEHAEGQYNVSNYVSDGVGANWGDPGNTIHSIGIGTSASDRKNAEEVMQNGDKYLIGVGGYDGTNPNTTGVKTVQEQLNEIPHKADKVLVATSIPASGLLPNTLYNVGTLTGEVTINLAAPTDSTIMNIYHICFETGATAPTITWGTAITSWMGGSAPTINANKHYEVSVLNGVAIAMEV